MNTEDKLVEVLDLLEYLDQVGVIDSWEILYEMNSKEDKYIITASNNTVTLKLEEAHLYLCELLVTKTAYLE